MKNLKKVLALVMAFAMAFTMMAGAAYTDQADIQATEAVDTLTALGVMAGDKDTGVFRPNDIVTRAEMCRMIYTIRSGGKTDASAYAGMQTTFKDVKDTAWYAGYVKYCQSVGIVSGKSTTSFDPNAPVTGVEAALMCLRVMGYDPKKADIGGSTWSTATIGLATEAGLLDNVDTAISAGLPRQWAAQIMFNLIGANNVKWSNDSETYIEAKGTVGSKYLKLATEKGKLSTVSKNDKGEYSFTVNGKTFTKVSKDYSALVGQNVKVLYKEGKQDEVYGVTADSSAKTLATGVVGDLEQITGETTKVKFGGTEYKFDGTPNVYKFNSDTVVKTLHALAGDAQGLQDGYTLQLIDKDDNGNVDSAVMTPFIVAQVAYTGSTSTTLNSVTGFDRIGNQKNEDLVTYEGMKQDDWTIVYKDNTVDKKIHVEKANVVTGEVSGTRNAGKEALIDGTWYTSLTSQTFNVGDKVDIVAVGSYVYNVKISDTSATTANLVYVEKSREDSSWADAKTLRANLYFTDGTSKSDVQISKVDDTKIDSNNAGSNVSTIAKKVFTYTVDGDKYELKNISASNKAGFKGYDTVTKYEDKALTLSANGSAKIADGAVLFAHGADGVKVLTGSAVNAWGKNAVNMAAANSTVLYSEANGFKYVQAGALNIASGDIPGASGDTAYGFVTADPYQIKVDGTVYIQYTVWTKDGSKTVRVKNSSVEADKGDFISFNIGDGEVIKDIKKGTTAGINAAAVTAYADGSKDINMVQNDGSSAISGFANKLANDATIIYVNTKDNTGAEGGKIAIAAKNANDKYIANVMYKLNNDNEVEVLFVDVNNDLEKDTTVQP